MFYDMSTEEAKPQLRNCIYLCYSQSAEQFAPSKKPIDLDTWWIIYGGYGDVTQQPLVGFFFIAIGCFSLILQKSC